MIGDISIADSPEELLERYKNMHHGNARVEVYSQVYVHVLACPHRIENQYHTGSAKRHEDCVEGCGERPLYKISMYEGCVISTRERNGYHDSDFYAIVWDEKNQTVQSVEYATTRFACSTFADIDATTEALDKAQLDYEQRYLQSLKYQYDRVSKVPQKGKMVEVVKGRKVPIGTKGEVFWTGDTQWGPRIGIRCDESKATWFIMAENVVVLEPEKYIPTDEKIAQEAKVLAANTRRYHNWHAYYAVPGYIQM